MTTMTEEKPVLGPEPRPDAPSSTTTPLALTLTEGSTNTEATTPASELLDGASSEVPIEAVKKKSLPRRKVRSTATSPEPSDTEQRAPMSLAEAELIFRTEPERGPEHMNARLILEAQEVISKAEGEQADSNVRRSVAAAEAEKRSQKIRDYNASIRRKRRFLKLVGVVCVVIAVVLMAISQAVLGA